MTKIQFFTQVVCWFNPHNYSLDKVEAGIKHISCKNCGKKVYLEKRFFTDKSGIKK